MNKQKKAELVIDLTKKELPNLGRTARVDASIAHSSRGYRHEIEVKDCEYPERVPGALLKLDRRISEVIEQRKAEDDNDA